MCPSINPACCFRCAAPNMPQRRVAVTLLRRAGPNPRSHEQASPLSVKSHGRFPFSSLACVRMSGEPEAPDLDWARAGNTDRAVSIVAKASPGLTPLRAAGATCVRLSDHDCASYHLTMAAKFKTAIAADGRRDPFNTTCYRCVHNIKLDYTFPGKPYIPCLQRAKVDKLRAPSQSTQK